MLQMLPCSVFRLQTMALRDDLTKEQEWLRSTPLENGPYGPFARKLRGEIQQTITDLNNLIPDCGSQVALPQERLAFLRRRTNDLFAEALTLRSADFIRNGQFDKGMCLVADKLLAELGRAVVFEVPHLSTLAESDFFGSSARVVRLRYPSVSIWELPVLGHEFGHSFGPEWRVQGALQPRPYEWFRENSKLRPVIIADEYFCDLLATFLLGPAYAYMCILQRFDPTNTVDDETHPSDLKRAWWVLRGLERLAEMASPETAAHYNGIAATLRGFWQAYLSESTRAALTDTDRLDKASEELFAKMEAGLPLAAYTDSGPVWGLVRQYNDGTPVTLARDQLRHLLNAAWFIRAGDLADNRKTARIDNWAHELARSAPL